MRTYTELKAYPKSGGQVSIAPNELGTKKEITFVEANESHQATITVSAEELRDLARLFTLAADIS